MDALLMAAAPLRRVLERVLRLHGCAGVRELYEHCAKVRGAHTQLASVRELVYGLACDCRCDTLLADVLAYASRLVRSAGSPWRGMTEGTLLYAVAVVACQLPAGEVCTALFQACSKGESAWDGPAHLGPLLTTGAPVKTCVVERVHPKMALQRVDEMRRLIGVLDRCSNYHVLLAGKRGVGRKALIQMLAQMNPAVPMHFIHADALVSADLVASALLDVLAQHAHSREDVSYTSLVCVTGAERVMGEASLMAAMQTPGLRVVLCVRDATSYLDSYLVTTYFTLLDLGPVPVSVTSAIAHERTGLPHEIIEMGLRATQLVPHHQNPGCVLDMLQGFAGFMGNKPAGIPVASIRACYGGDALSSTMVRVLVNGAPCAASATSEDFALYLEVAYNIVLPPEETRVTPLETLQERLAGIKHQLAGRVYGQDDVCTEVTRVLCQRLILKHDDPDRPTTFVFAGSTGVGKTTMADALGRAFFGDPTRVVTLNMAEFNTPESSARLLGMHAGYVGYEDIGLLTRIIQKTPECLLILDECEKAHPDLNRLFLSIMGEHGVILDNRNNTLKFGKCIIVMTTNLGQEDILNTELPWAERVRRVNEKLVEHFSRELVGRVDSCCVFHPLTPDVLEKIGVDVIESCNRTLTQYSTRVDCSPDTLRALMCTSASARDIKRAVKRLVMSRVSNDIVLDGRCSPSYLLVVVDGAPVVQ